MLFKTEPSSRLQTVPARLQNTPPSLLFKREDWLPGILGWMFKPWQKLGRNLMGIRTEPTEAPSRSLCPSCKIWAQSWNLQPGSDAHQQLLAQPAPPAAAANPVRAHWAGAATRRQGKGEGQIGYAWNTSVIRNRTHLHGHIHNSSSFSSWLIHK